MEKTLLPIMYGIPSDPTVSKVTITADCVKNGVAPLIERDESRTETKLTTTQNFAAAKKKK